MAAAAPTVRGYGPAAAVSSVALHRPRPRMPASFTPMATRRAALVRFHTAIADARPAGCSSTDGMERASFCTHFCLARVHCFGDPIELQLYNAWFNRLAGRR